MFNEPRLAEAIDLIRDSELLAPTLLAYELGSIARKKILLYPGFKAKLLASLEDALAMDIRWVEVDHCAIVELALESSLTTCDASYLHLARSLGVPLATCDQELLAAIWPGYTRCSRRPILPGPTRIGKIRMGEWMVCDTT